MVSRVPLAWHGDWSIRWQVADHKAVKVLHEVIKVHPEHRENAASHVHTVTIFTNLNAASHVHAVTVFTHLKSIILKKIQTELTAAVLKNWSKTQRRLNRTFFNQTKQDWMQIFEGILFFKATNSTKPNKSLSCCQLGASRPVPHTSFWKYPTDSS